MATGGQSDIERGTDETFDFLCSVCIRKNKNIEAVKFCTDCQEYFCSTCVRWHNDFPALKHLQILDKGKFQPGSSSSSVQFPVVPTERCKEHGHKPVDMFCRQHDKVGCSTCMVVNHSACPEKFYVPEYTKNYTKECDPEDNIRRLDTIADTLRELQNAFLGQKKQFTNSKENSLKLIRKVRNEINQGLDELEKNTVLKLEGQFQFLSDKIENTMREIQTVTTEIESAQDSLKSAGGNMSQMFVSIKMANDVASHAYETVKSTKLQVSSTELSSSYDQKLKTLLNELQVLGSISLTEKPKSQPPIPVSVKAVGKTRTRLPAGESISSPSLMQIRGSKKYSAIVKSEDNCTIVSVCALEDGTLILATGKNNKLTCLDSSLYTVIDSCEVPETPWQVCAISNQEAAVSCYLSHLVQFVSIGRSLQKTRQIKIGFACFGLAYGDRQLFISDGDISVHVFTLSGTRVQGIHLPYCEPEGYYVDLQCIAVSSDNSKIYVAHRVFGLIILDREGQIIGQSTGHKCNEVNDVCLFKNDIVLVLCGHKSNSVLQQFSSDGKQIGMVLKRNTSCTTLTCCKKNSKLIVGAGEEIEVYDII